VEAVVAGDADGTSGVPHGDVLTAFAEALVQGDDAALTAARTRLARALGPGGLVDAAAVASNFERMNRIADATGIPLDAPVAALSSDLRDALRLDRFASAAHTRRLGWIGRSVGASVRAILARVLKRAAAKGSRSADSTRG
jgi:hypothetical protein